jgi:hypothetical protein
VRAVLGGDDGEQRRARGARGAGVDADVAVAPHAGREQQGGGGDGTGAAAERLGLVGGDGDVAGDVERLAAAGADDLRLERDGGGGHRALGVVTWPAGQEDDRYLADGQADVGVVRGEHEVLALADGDAGVRCDRQGLAVVLEGEVGWFVAGVGDEGGEAGAVGLLEQLCLDGPEVAAVGSLEQGGGVAGAQRLAAGADAVAAVGAVLDERAVAQDLVELRRAREVDARGRSGGVGRLAGGAVGAGAGRLAGGRGVGGGGAGRGIDGRLARVGDDGVDRRDVRGRYVARGHRLAAARDVVRRLGDGRRPGAGLGASENQRGEHGGAGQRRHGQST